MKRFNYCLFFCCFFILLKNGYSQDISAEIQLLENDLRNFNYPKVLTKGRFLLSEPNITKKDSLKIYEYIINAAYSLNDTISAKNVIKDALKCSQNFSPDPRITSPKIISYFNSVKAKLDDSTQKVKSETTEPPSLTFEPVAAKYLLTSLLYPGSSHLIRGYKKGYYFTGISSILLGTIVYSSIQVADTRDKYMRARSNVNFDELYNNYNSAYKIRNVLVFSYFVFNLYTLYDFYSSEIKNTKSSMSIIQNQNSIILQYTYSW